MATSPLIPLLLLLLPLYITAVHSSSSSDVESWCRSTPHPHSCRNCLSRANSPPGLLTQSDFYKLSLQAALDLAVHARTRVARLGNSCDGAAERTAWHDCHKLFANTAFQLNRTLSRSGGSSSVLDEQTWLSAALTNLNTCNRGFAELKANASFMRPVLRYNLSDIVSNCLAINNASFDATVAWGGGRRRLQGSGGADFVVAQDGTGNFKTVREAVEAAEGLRRRRRRGRIVIHVKAGVYAEYLVIGSGFDDLTIAGDGKGKTIITGNRSVALGFTTFSCPTVSKMSTN